MIDKMRLAYNYTTNEFIYYPSEADEQGLFFDSFHDPDSGENLGTFIKNGDAYSVFAVGHWTVEYLDSFMRASDSVRMEVLQHEKEVL